MFTSISTLAAFVAAGAAQAVTPIDATIIDPLTESVISGFHSQLASCPSLPPRTSPPTNVSDVRPDDISVVMAMGDSVVCGLNSRYFHNEQFSNETYRGNQPQIEFRGASFVTGGDPDVFSLAGIIDHLRQGSNRSSLMGMSRGTMPLEFCAGPLCPSGSFLQPFNANVMGLDAAQAGSWVTYGNIDNQFKYLDKYYEHSVPKHVESPWKLLVYEHGFNNLCFGCNFVARGLYFKADYYEATVRYMIDGLYERFNNMIVVLASPFKLSQVYHLIKNDTVCASIHNSTSFLCPCVFNNPSVDHNTIDDLADQYRQRLIKIAADYQSRGWTDFAVVYDGGFSQTDLSQGAASELLSGRDCFHPSMRSHTQFAASLWNNLVVPQSQKRSYSIDPNHQIRCPKADDRISLI